MGSKGEKLYVQEYFFIKKIRENKVIARMDVGSRLHTGRNDAVKRENTGKYRGERTNAQISLSVGEGEGLLYKVEDNCKLFVK